jgi:hypothetical protein
MKCWSRTRRDRQQDEQQRRGDVVRQVADDAQRSSVGSGKRFPVECEGVAFDQVELQRREAAAQPGGKIAVDLDGSDGARARNERRGQRAQPGTDFDDALSRPRVDGGGDTLDVVRIVQEILREPPPGAMAFHQRAAAGVSRRCHHSRNSQQRPSGENRAASTPSSSTNDRCGKRTKVACQRAQPVSPARPSGCAAKVTSRWPSCAPSVQ